MAAFLVIFSFTTLDSFAVGDAFLTQMCNVSNIVTGNGGKAFAAFAVISVGIGFFSGKVSWGLLIGVSMGIGSIFGAPSIVAAISGQSAFECEVGVVYVTTCSNGVCSACPRGHTEVGCSACSTGFTGANCATCDTGYIGTLCDSCDTQYTKVNGVCQLKKCDSGPIVGVAAANSSVDLGNNFLNCDAINYSGNVTYSCSNGAFSIITNSCICPVKYDQSNCTSCATGYSGAPTCTSCAANYTKSSGICQKDCKTSGFTGIPDNTPAIAPSGTLSCISAGYQGTINYTCSSGSFSSSDSCTCANGYVPNGSGCIIIQDCTGGAITTVSGKKIHLFDASGSFFTCPTSRIVEYLIIGGGGGGGYDGAGGSGGGGFKSGSLTVSTSPYPITVGTGGAEGDSVGSQASDGLPSSFNGITASGGG